MAATSVRTTAAGVAHSWRDLARMPTYQVPMVLGGFLAAVIGLLTYVFDIVEANAIVAVTSAVAYLVIFGVLGLIGYGVSKENAQNGALVAAIAGLALVAFVGETVGMLTGLLLLGGAVWTLASTR